MDHNEAIEWASGEGPKVKTDINIQSPQEFAKRFKALQEFRDKLKRSEFNIVQEDLHETLDNAKGFEQLKRNYFNELNNIHYLALCIMNKNQYRRFQRIVTSLKNEW